MMPCEVTSLSQNSSGTCQAGRWKTLLLFWHICMENLQNENFYTRINCWQYPHVQFSRIRSIKTKIYNISPNPHCHPWKKWQYRRFSVPSEINQGQLHWIRCISARFKAMRLREGPEPNLRMETAIDLKEYMWTSNIRKACKRMLGRTMHAEVPKLSWTLQHVHTPLATTISFFGFENL